MKVNKLFMCCCITAFILTSTPSFIMCVEAETQDGENAERETMSEEELRNITTEREAKKITLESQTKQKAIAEHKHLISSNVEVYDDTSTGTSDKAPAVTTKPTTVKPAKKVPVKYRVTYISNGGSAVTSQNVSEGSRITFLATPARSGYRFAGWYKDSTFKTKFNQSEPIRKNMTLYAKWEQVQCTVWFDSNGGSQVPSVKVLGDTRLDILPVSTKEGYELEGWYTDTGNRFSSADKIYTNTTLHARWELIIPDKAPDEAKDFIDVDENAWYYKDVQWAYSNKYMSGYNNALFAPMNVMTISNIVTVLAKMSETDVSVFSETVSGIQENMWYTPYGKWAVNTGLVSSSEFLPDMPVSRENMCVIFEKFLDLTGKQYDIEDGKIDFTDSALISAESNHAIQTLFKLGVLMGKNNNTIDPKGTLTRAEFAAFAHRLSGLN